MFGFGGESFEFGLVYAGVYIPGTIGESWVVPFRTCADAIAYLAFQPDPKLTWNSPKGSLTAVLKKGAAWGSMSPHVP